MKFHVRFRNFSQRQKLWLCSACGLFVPLLYPGWILITGPAALRISAETTFITNPLHSSGYVDYAPEINRIRQYAVPANATLDVEAIVNACDELRTISPKRIPNPAEFDLEIPEEVDRKLTAFINLLRRHQGVVALAPMQQATPFRHPMMASVDDNLLSSIFFNFLARDVSTLLRHQTRQAIKRGDGFGVAAGLEASDELIRFMLRRKTILAVMFAHWSQRGQIVDLLNGLCRDQLSADSCRRILTEMPTIDYAALKNQLRLERIWSLAATCSLHSGEHPLGGMGRIGNPTLFQIITDSITIERLTSRRWYLVGWSRG